MGIEQEQFTRIGVLGAGRAGTALARLAAESGIEVQIAGSRPPQALKYHLMQYAPHAIAVEASQIASGVDLVVLMVPQEELDDVDTASLGNVILVDATNRWQEEPIPEWFEQSSAAGLSSSEAIAQHFSNARVVKSLNHVSHWDLDSVDRTGSIPPRGMVVASDYSEAAQKVAALIFQLGYEPILLSTLAAGRVTEPGTSIFGALLSAQEISDQIQRSGEA